jgi:hypothetical protein
VDVEEKYQDYNFNLTIDTSLKGTISRTSGMQLPAVGDPRLNASHVKQTENPRDVRMVTLVLRSSRWEQFQTERSEALIECNKEGATLFIPQTLEDLWQFTYAVAAALRMHKDPIYSERFFGRIWLGGDKTQPDVWLPPGSGSSGSSRGLPGMNMSVFSPGTPPWTPDPARTTDDCLQLISWSNLQYASWLQWGACRKHDEAAYACVKTSTA